MPPPIADLWSAAGAALQSQRPSIEPVPRDQPAPLSFAQERLWGLSREPGASSYNVPWAWQVTGPLDAALLEQSLRSIVHRHEILHTHFVAGKSGPAAVVEHEEFQLNVVDLQGRPDAHEMFRLAAEEARRPFDLERGPLFRATLFRVSPSQHLFLITVHQIVFDGGSLRPLVQELGLTYQSLAGGKTLPVTPLPIQYADFAAWQRGSTHGPQWEADQAYWRQQLHTPYQPLPLGEPGPIPNSGIIRKLFWPVPPGLFPRLKLLAARENVTPFTALLAAVQALLSRYTGSRDVITFTSTSARIRPELRGMIGLLANALPMRGDLSGEPSFRDLLARLRELELANLAHQTFPFEKILEVLRVERGSAPLFQVMLLYRNAPLPAPAIDGLRFRAIEHEIETAASPFDLLLELAESNGGLHAALKYRPERFDAAAAAAFLHNLHLLLREVIAHPGRPLHALPLQIPAARKAAAALRVPAVTVAPANSLEEQLVAIWQKLFDRKPIGTRDNFFDLGGHSVMAVRMFAELAPFIGQRLPPSALFGAPTIEQLARQLQTRAPVLRSLVAIQPRGSKPPLYCISGVGGSVFLFNQLSDYLGDDQPIYGLEPPEPDGQHLPPIFLEEIAAHYVREIRAAQPDGPYHLVGFSFGGMVAFEIAQQLLTLRQEVGLLALFDSEQTASSRTWSWRTRMLNRLHGHFFRLRPLVLGPDRWAAASTICRAKVLKLLFHLHGMFGHTIPAALAGAASTEDRHVFARDRYQPKLYRGRVTLFRARIRPDFEAYDYELGWKQLAQGGVEVHEVPGDHHTMSQEPNVAVLAEEFRRCLEGAYARSKEYRYR